MNLKKTLSDTSCKINQIKVIGKIELIQVVEYHFKGINFLVHFTNKVKHAIEYTTCLTRM